MSRTSESKPLKGSPPHAVLCLVPKQSGGASRERSGCCEAPTAKRATEEDIDVTLTEQLARESACAQA